MGAIRASEEGARDLAGDGQGFAQLFEQHSDEIWRYLASQVGRQEADDLLSEVFARAFSHRSSFVPGLGTARGWLYGIAHNVCREYLRHEQERSADPSSFEDTSIVAPEDGLATGEVLEDALRRLPEERRAVVLLIGAVGLSYREAAQALAVPVGTVRSRFHRGRRQLRELLQERRTHHGEADS